MTLQLGARVINLLCCAIVLSIIVVKTKVGWEKCKIISSQQSK